MSWDPWSSVSQGNAAVGSSVTAVPIGDNRFTLFLADPGGGVFTASGNAQRGWSPWSSVAEGRAGPGTSVTAVPIAGNRFALFVADPGGGVFTASGNAQLGWGQWSTVSEGRAGPGTSITAVKMADGRIALFAADPGGGVFTASQNAQLRWSRWSSVSEGRAGPRTSVTAVPMAGGRIALFAADPGGGVFTASGNAQRWSPWSSVSEGRAGPGTSVTAVPLAGGRFALFVADPGGGVFTASGNAERGWSPWSSVSEGRAGPGTSVTAVPMAGDRFALFVADPGGGVFTASGNAEQGWSGWSSVSQGHAGPGSSVTAQAITQSRLTVFLADPGGGVFTTSGDSGGPIKHVFVLMLENRSFDHMLGFSGITGIDTRTGRRTAIDGLRGNESNDYTDSDGNIHSHTVATGAPDVMVVGPGHNFLSVLAQLCGPQAAKDYRNGDPYPPINNSGYVADYANTITRWNDHRKAEARRTLPNVPGMDALMDKQASKIDRGSALKCFSPSQLPVLNALAREFVVCDRWFGSMPGPTEPNRMFVHAASSGAFDDSPSSSAQFGALVIPDGGFEFEHGTVFKQLKKAGVKYRIYADDNFPNVAELHDISILDVREFEDFAKDLKDLSFDAGYVFIEPSYDALDDFEDGNSQHPLGSVAAGERYIKATYEAIRNSPVWDRSLLIVTWDEHGGFYDHVIPGLAEKTGHRGAEHGFRFDQLGPRVPAVIVSPRIPANLIEHRIFDHTAIPATLSGVFKLPPLGARNGISGGVDRLVGLVLRAETPAKLPDVATAGVAALAPTPTRPTAKTAARRPAALLSDDPHGNLAGLLHSAVVQHLQIAPPEQHAAILVRVRLLETHAELFAYLKEVEHLVREKRG